MIALHKIWFSVLLLCVSHLGFAQFIDNFDPGSKDPGWVVNSGDGEASIKFERYNGFGRITVDATEDKLNIWWSLIRLQVPDLDLRKLTLPQYELRVEAKIKVSHAPRRVNLHFNHSRTTDYHSHLMEYDIGDTSNWHVISMTTQDFEVTTDDNVNVQMALMDWGKEIYTVDVDYVKVDIVNQSLVEVDLGNPQEYRPKVPNLEDFSRKVIVNQCVTLDKQYAENNFSGWNDPFQPDTKLLSVNQNQLVILKANLEEYRSLLPEGIGVLKMHLHHIEKSSDFTKDFGMLRLVEIVGGPQAWDSEKITYQKFTSVHEPVFNGQMIIDVSLTDLERNEIYFTLSEAVLKRLFTGKTKGLAILPLGAIHASFYANNFGNDAYAPEIYFNIE